MQLQEPSPQADNGYAAQLLRFSVKTMWTYHILSFIHQQTSILMNQ